MSSKSHLCGCADDVGIFIRTKEKLVEVFSQIKKNGEELGLMINECKTVM